MLAETVRQLQKDAHENAIQRGWWSDEKKRNIHMICALFHSEVSEALEEHRNHHSANEIYYDPDDDKPNPQGIPIELADVAIRLFDWSDHEHIDLATQHTGFRWKFSGEKDVAADLNVLHNAISTLSMVSKSTQATVLAEIWQAVQDFADRYDIDLENAIKIKMKYNETRSFRHGNKKI